MTLKIVIPTAGWGTRLRPQTWSKPKPLVGLAGKTALDHLLDSFKSISAGSGVEYVFIVGPYLGESQIPPYLHDHYPDLKIHYVVQTVMRGQSDALWLARQHLNGPMVMCFSDTLIQTDFSHLAGEQADGVAWVRSVPDPRPFGVAEVDKEGLITKLTEKPKTMDNKLVVVGCYYFHEAGELVSAIEEQIKRGISRKGEFFLADAVNVMLARGAHMRTQPVDIWLDTGTLEATLAANRYLLEHGQANRTNNEKQNGVEVVAPVFIHASARIEDAVIGPHVSIGPDCRIRNARIQDSILEAGVTVRAAALKGSFIGRQAKVRGRSSEDAPMVLNIGDDSSLTL